LRGHTGKNDTFHINIQINGPKLVHCVIALRCAGWFVTCRVKKDSPQSSSRTTKSALCPHDSS